MNAFAAALKEIAKRLPEADAVLVMGADGIPVEKLLIRGAMPFDAVAAEIAGLLRSRAAGTDDTGLGGLREMAIACRGLTVVASSITPEYFVMALIGAGVAIGRARFVLRVASLKMEQEFS